MAALPAGNTPVTHCRGRMGFSKYGSQPQHVTVDMATMSALLVGGVTERSGGERRMAEMYCFCYHGDG